MIEEPVEPVQVFVRIRPESSGFKGLRSSTPERKTATITSRQIQSPKISQSLDGNQKCAVMIDDKTVRITPPDGTLGSRKSVSAVDDKLFSFDKLFPEEGTQEDVYQSVSAHVKATVRGYNTTIFAYGSTGSGKSYTMTGNSTAPGIIPRAISEIFSIIEATAAQESDVFFYVRLSYVELYNNNFKNLLEFASKELSAKERTSEGENDERGRSTSPTQMHPGIAHKTDKIEVRESQSAGVFLAGPSLRIPVTTAQEAFQLIAKGNKVRAVGSTQCNDVSSRSHAILTLHVESRVPSGTGGPLGGPSVGLSGGLSQSSNTPLTDSSWNMGGTQAPSELRLGKMHLVDLAGSERVALSGAEGDTLLETQNINLSLTAIGDVLSALSRNAMVIAQQHKAANQQVQGLSPSVRTPLSLVPVPYRNSKLTHLLKDSLGGNSKTIMVATIRTDAEYYQQTAVTLMYAARAKKVRNRSLVNRNVIGDTGIHAVTKEIERLKNRLDERSNEFEHLRHTQLKDANENNALRARLQHLKDANESEKKQLETQMSHIIHSQAGQLASQRHRSQNLQQSLQEELQQSQERIAVQEREILGLKKALDDSVLAKHQPVEQMGRMQKVLDAWQAQAVSTQQELDASIKQTEALKQQNNTLILQLNATKVTIQELNEEKEEISEELTAKGEESSEMQSNLLDMTKEKEYMKTLMDAAQAESLNFKLKLKTAQDDTTNFKLKLKLAVEGAMITEATLKSLEDDLQGSRKETGRVQTELETAEARILDLETDKAAILLKLEGTIGALEERTLGTIEKATSRLQDGDRKLKLADGKMMNLEQELLTAQSLLSSAQESSAKAGANSRAQLAHLTSLLEIEKESLRESVRSCRGVEDKYQALKIVVAEKDVLLKSAEIYMTEQENKLATAQEKVKKEISTLTDSHKRELEVFKNEKDQHVKLFDEEKREYEKREEGYRADLLDLERALKHRHLSEVRDTVDGLKEEHLIEMKDAIDKMKVSHNAEMKELRGSQEELNRLHASEVRDIEDGLKRLHQTEMRDFEDGLREVHVIAMQRVKSEANDLVEKTILETEMHIQETRKRFLDDAESLKDRSLSAAEIKFATEFLVLKNSHERDLDDLRSVLEEENKEIGREVKGVREELEILMEKNKENEEIIRRQKEILLLEKEKIKEKEKEREEERENEREKEREIEIEAREEMQVALQTLRCELESKHTAEKHEKEQEKDIAFKKMISENTCVVQGLKEEYERNMEDALKSQEEELRKEAKESMARALSSLSDVEQSAAAKQLVHQEELTTLRYSLHEDFQDKFAALKKDLENSHAETLENRQKEFETEIENLKISNEKEFRELMNNHENDVIMKMKEMKIEYDEKLNLSAEKVREEMMEIHAEEMITVLNKQQKEHQIEMKEIQKEHESELLEMKKEMKKEMQEEMQELIRSNRKKLNEEFATTSKEMIESLGKQGRDALETQRQQLEKVRLQDIEKCKSDISILETEHEERINMYRIEQHKAVQNALIEQKTELEDSFKSVLRDKETAFKGVLEAAAVISGAERELALTTIRAKQELDLDRHQEEVSVLRQEAVLTVMRHQRDLSEALENHLNELSALRVQLEAQSERDISILRSQLLEAKERYGDVMAQGAERQGSEMRTQRLQREEFEIALQATLTERDTYHKQTVKALTGSHEAERSRLATALEREKTRLLTDTAHLSKEHSLDILKMEASWKAKADKIAVTEEEKHLEAMRAAATDQSTKHREELRASQSEAQRVEEQLRGMLRETQQQMQDLSVSQAKQVGDLNKRIDEMRGELAAVNSVVEEERNRSDDALLLAEREMEQMREEFTTQLRIAESDYTTQTDGLKTLLSTAHTQAIIAAHTHSELTVSSIIDENNLQTKILQDTHHSDMIFLKEEFEGKFSDQKGIFERRLVEEKERIREEGTAKIEDLVKKQSMELSTILTASQESERSLRNEFNETITSLHLSHNNVIDALKTTLEEGHQEDRDRLVVSHEEEMQKAMLRHEQSIEAMRLEDSKALDAVRRKHEDELASVRLSSEMDGYERAKLSEREIVSSLTRSLEELKIGMERQHEGDLDALSEEAVKVTNRLKGRLTAAEQENVLLKERSQQFLATKAKDDSESSILRVKVKDLESALNRQEEASRVLLAHAREEIVKDSEKTKEKLETELNTVKTSEKNIRKALALVEKENQENTSENNRRHDAEIVKLEKLNLESELLVAKLKNELNESRDHSRVLAEHSAAYKECSPKIIDLTQRLQRVEEERNVLQRDMQSVQKEKTFLEDSAAEFERRASHLAEELEGERDRGGDREDKLIVSQSLLSKAERQLSDLRESLSSSERTRREAEGAVIAQRDELESTQSAAQDEINHLQEELSLSKRYVEGLLIEITNRETGAMYQGGDLRRALAVQQNEMQGGYLSLLMNQVNCVMDMIQNDESQGGVLQIEAAHERFLHLMKNLPEEWKRNANNDNKDDEMGREGREGYESDYGGEPATSEVDEYGRNGARISQSSLHSSQSVPRPTRPLSTHPSLPATYPLHPSSTSSPPLSSSSLGLVTPSQSYKPPSTYMSQSMSSVRSSSRSLLFDTPRHDENDVLYNDPQNPQTLRSDPKCAPQNPRNDPTPRIGAKAIYKQVPKGGTVQETDKASDKVRQAQYSGRPVLPWSSPALRSSPTDQLIAAILDGDSHGIKSVVKAKGDTLTAGFWKDLSPSILPLHRAISGLHFHGSDKLLIATIECLISLGASPNAVDKMGNTALHKSITVCTSRSVSAVVSVLLSSGGKPSLKNKEGDTPLHLECKRIRRASVDVIAALLLSGADPNSRNADSTVASRATSDSRSAPGQGVSALTLILKRCSKEHSADSKRNALDDSDDNREEGDGEFKSRDKVQGLSSNGNNGGIGVGEGEGHGDWIHAALRLIKTGAQWDLSWRSLKGETQLFLLLSTFPPPPSKDHFTAYKALLVSALGAGFSPITEDARGVNALFALCEKMARIPLAVCPEAPSLFGLLLEACGSNGVGGSNHSGVTLFDIKELTTDSCLGAVKPMIALVTMRSQSATAHKKRALEAMKQSNIGVTSGGGNGGGYSNTNGTIGNIAYGSSSGIGSSGGYIGSVGNFNGKNEKSNRHSYNRNDIDQNKSSYSNTTRDSITLSENNDRVTENEKGRDGKDSERGKDNNERGKDNNKSYFPPRMNMTLNAFKYTNENPIPMSGKK